MSDKIESAVEAMIDKLRSYCLVEDGKQKPLSLNTRTKYFSQRDNYTMPHRTCNSSANAMWLDWVMRATGRPGLNGDDRYLRTVLNIGDTIYHENQTEAIKRYGFKSTWRTDGDEALLEAVVKKGIPATVNILHRGSRAEPRGGHIILLCGLRPNGTWVVQDPYGTLDSGYTDTDGEHDTIGDREFLARWQGGYRVIG
jgi:hypothetical protein